tara:strand:+ start:451 stop:1392 length:942 start_codon:yes stop_codon:yes gene_type:complete
MFKSNFNFGSRYTNKLFVYFLFGFFLTTLYFGLNKDSYSRFKVLIYNNIIKFEELIGRSKSLSKCGLSSLSYIPKESILIIGHAYGSKDNNEYLAKKIRAVLNSPRNLASYIIFSGDNFNIPSLELWSRFTREFSDRYKIFVAPGNHDVGQNNTHNPLLDIFMTTPYYPSDGKYPFINNINNINFIIENSSENNRTISNKTFNILNTSNKSDKYIVIMHHLPVRYFYNQSNIQMSRKQPRTHHLLNRTERDVTIISGDTGILGPSTTCIKDRNFKFIANGIGNKDKDQILVVYNHEIYTLSLNQFLGKETQSK